ncbi:fat-like cadherin-related tumor suppressor homolog [Centruroides sculpturatus]|uniref:fat-like cadherin-related tumor suppressor homolog n=1 Tax=Centruroides sculpturatus TaxID=218467 RepID=UPI000C6CF501|nr:fat-like cadherin-related tumor suppressor homolog [Centruroides sculpturatus]
MTAYLTVVCLLLVLSGRVRSRGDGPRFTRTVYRASVPENSVSKTYVTSEEMMGMYVSDPALDVRFKIVSGDKDRFFKAEARRVGDFCFLAIRTRTGLHAVLNREYQDRYRLEVRAAAAGPRRKKIKLKAQTAVDVRILDTNDLNPLFYPTEYEVNVTEDTPPYRSLLRVSAFDPDLGVNGEIYYRFLQPTLQFAVHPTRGAISLSRPLHHRRQSSYDLLVVAEDRGPKFRAGDVRASSATVRVRVVPVNLHAPEIFIRYFPVVRQTAPDSILAVVTVADEDPGIHGRIAGVELEGDPEGRFRLVAGSEPGEYNLLADGRPPPAEYSLTVRATDSGVPPKSSTQTIRPKLPETGDGVPVFPQSYYEASVDETAPVGTPVLVVSVAAPSDRNSEIFYSVEGEDDDCPFSVDSRTGAVRISAPLDRETKSLHTLVVSAVDKSVRGVRAKGTAQVTVRVSDANDNDPVFNVTSAEVDLDENRPAGSPVYTAYAEDPDRGENGYVSYSLANVNPVPFRIDPFTGKITTTDVLDYETTRRQYLLKIRASDWGTPFRRQTETSLRIRLRDVNDHRPLFEKIDCEVYVSSAAPPGTPLLRLSAVDFDAGSAVSYRTVPSGPHPCFSLDSSAGFLTLTCHLDRQKFRQALLNVTATDGKHFSDVVPVRIRVVGGAGGPGHDGQTSVECRDVGVAERLREQNRLGELNNRPEDVTEPTPTTFRGNRHPPEFPGNRPAEVRVNESLPVGSEVADLSARDADRGYNGRLVYAIASGDDDCRFRIDPFTGKLGVFAPLDREERDEYVLNVTVWDLGQPPKSASTLFAVRVLDVNDNRPVFEKSSYHLVVPENVRNGTSIVRLRATDEDSGPNAQLRFEMETPVDEFGVEAESGLLTVRSSLDREKRDEYRLKMTVRDLSPDRPLSSSATVTVRVLDVNDNPPRFALPLFRIKLREDLPPGAVVMVLSADDPDLEEGGRVEYEIRGGSDGKFSVDPETGAVRLSDRLDFERRQLYNVTVEARDGGAPPLTSAARLLVEVEDVDENAHAPRFPDFAASAAVRENAPAGTRVKRVSATDDDGPGPDGRVTYSVVEGDGLGLFSVDDSGEVRTRCPLDRETASGYWLTVHARDGAAVPASSRLYLYVEVTDENDNVPLTFEPVYYAQVPENSPEGTAVVKLNAFDLDSNPRQTVVYSISSGDSDRYFSIDPARGIVSTASLPLDREKKEEHVLEIKVEDGGKPPLSSVTRLVVEVVDRNDNQPEFLVPKYHCHALEKKSSDDALLCQVLAVDADRGANADVTYEIIEGNKNGKFKIHSEDGTITSRATLVAGQKFELLVKASDNGHPVRTTTTRVLLDIVARRKKSVHPPVVKDTDSVIVVAETDKIGDLVALIQADDLDGDRLWYYIFDGNKENVFMMQQPDMGAILLRKQLHWELQSKYNLTVAITDGIHLVYHVLQIEVKDGNNYRPQFSEQTYNVDVSENIKSGTEILKLQATDKDQDKRFFYSIINR